MTPYGCNNSERKASYFVHDRQYDEQHKRYCFVMTEIIDHSSRECRYDMRSTDQQCAGCRK